MNALSRILFIIPYLTILHSILTLGASCSAVGRTVPRRGLSVVTTGSPRPVSASSREWRRPMVSQPPTPVLAAPFE